MSVEHRAMLLADGEYIHTSEQARLGRAIERWLHQLAIDAFPTMRGEPARDHLAWAKEGCE